MDRAWTFARRQDQVGTMARLSEHSSHGRHLCCKDQARGRYAFDGMKKRTSMCFHDSSKSPEASRESDRCILPANVSLHHRIDVSIATRPLCRISLVVCRNIVVDFRRIRMNVSLSSVNMSRVQLVPFNASNPNEKQPSFSVDGSATFHKPKMTVRLRAQGRPHMVARFIHATWCITHVRMRCTDVRTCPTK